MTNHQIKTGHINIIVEKVRVLGSGGIILTGPSSCGKGEIASELSNILSIPKARHLSMGSILRDTIDRANNDKVYKDRLASHYGISNIITIYDVQHNEEKVIEKAKQYEKELNSFYEVPTQFNYLEYCVHNGILIPDKWTIQLISSVFESNTSLRDNIFILDGYPRTIEAAVSILNIFKMYDIPIIKVIHLSITKEEMLERAKGRNRQDDTLESLERRYQFYIDQVQPTIDYLKLSLGSSRVVLIDAHQPVFTNGVLDVKRSIKQVALSVLHSLGLPGYLLE